jgi:hypothetical protein
MSHLRLPELKGQVPIFISSRNRMAQLYPPALSSLFIASYDSQGYDGGILAVLHTACSLYTYINNDISFLLLSSRKASRNID